MQTCNEVTRMWAEMLQACLDRGMKLPLHVACVGLNGSTLVMRYTEGVEGLDCEFLAEHYEDRGFSAPMNMMVVDSLGDAARVTWGAFEEGNQLVVH